LSRLSENFTSNRDSGLEEPW